MSHTLYSWHPIRGVTHQALGIELTEFMQALMKHDRQYDPYLPEYYVFSNDGLTTQWWYYHQARVKEPDEVPSISTNPWQKRGADGVPKQIRAYHLLLV